MNKVSRHDIFSALAPTSDLPEQVAREIGLRIMREDFKPGDVLAKESIDLRLNVSRPALREALKMLGAKGSETLPKWVHVYGSVAEWSLSISVV